jgi:predicted AlkP superfamily phosphohydrolase/phosphomutase
LTIGDETRRLAVGEWSDWVPVHFPLMPFQRLSGMCRFLLKQAKPSFQLYASPINLDPFAPAMTISTPSSYAVELAEATGRYATQGIAEDTQALSAHVLTRDEFLHHARLSAGDAERQFWHVLSDFRDGLLFVHFGNLDQVSHMLWRARDPAHPAYDADRDAPYRAVIDDLYVGVDRLVGETLRRAGPGTTLVVLSDHGFTSWRRSFNLNGWLRDRGDLVAAEPDRQADGHQSAQIDWTRTRAYGMGLNGLYLNLRGRERHGIVERADRDRLLEQLRAALLDSVDPATGRRAITRVFVNTESTAGTGPDLIVGYAEGTRVSNESALGRVPPVVFEDNTSEWSGDHCMDPAAVPGILLASRPLRRPPSGLEGVAAAIVAEFNVR